MRKKTITIEKAVTALFGAGASFDVLDALPRGGVRWVVKKPPKKRATKKGDL